MTTSEKVEPDWVCLECAHDRGADIPTNHMPTWHEDICGICGEKKMVTQPRDFGKTRKLLKVEEK